MIPSAETMIYSEIDEASVILLQQHPLKFRVPTQEASYSNYVTDLLGKRVFLVSISLFLVSNIFDLPVFFSDFKKLKKPLQIELIVMQTFLICVSLTAQILLIVSSFKKSWKQIMEYIIVYTCVTIFFATLLRRSLILWHTANTADEPFAGSVITVQIFWGVVRQFLYLIAVDMMFRIRTCVSLVLHIIPAIIAVCLSPIVIILDDFFVLSAEDYASIIAYCATTVIGPSFMYFGTRYFEKQARIQFHNLRATKSKLAEVRNRIKHRRSSLELINGRSNIELITKRIQEAEGLLVTLISEHGGSFEGLGIYSFVEQIWSLQVSTLDALTSGKNVYAQEIAVEAATCWVADPHTLNPLKDSRSILPKLSISQIGDLAITIEPAATVRLGPSFQTLSYSIQREKKVITEIGSVWEMDIFLLDRITNQQSLCVTGEKLIERTFPDEINHISFSEFLKRLHGKYKNISYHNHIHAAQVAHHMFLLTRYLGLNEYLAPMDGACQVIAALGHDVGHPGFNNHFYVHSGNQLALIYNDKSVLENFHAYLTFQLLMECGVYVNLPFITYRNARRRIIDLILETDMAHHFSTISSFRVRREAPGFLKEYSNGEEDIWLIAKMCIKLSDIGHATLNYEQHADWCHRIMDEFYHQGDEEIKQGLPISPLCDRKKHSEMASSQSSFVQFLVMPLLVELELVCPDGIFEENLVKRADANMMKWKLKASENQ